MISKKQLLLLLSGLIFGMGVGLLVFNNFQDNSAEKFQDEDPLDQILHEFMHLPAQGEKTLGDEANEFLHQAHESSHQELLNRMRRKKTDQNETSFLPEDPADEGPLEFDDYLGRFKDPEVGTIEEFKAALVQVTQKIPTIDEIRQLPAAELHHMPRPMQVVGIYMGDLKEILQQRHEFYSDGMRTYRLCALNPQYMDAIRALCLANLIEFGDEREDGLDGRYPRQIIDLAMQVRNWP